MHATHVLHAMHWLLTEGGVLRDLKTRCGMDDADCASVLLAAIIGAAVHDVGHLGVNNAFLRHTKLVQDDADSPMEHHHVAVATKVYHQLGGDFMEGGQGPELWRRATSMVLATDLSRHQLELTRAEALLVPQGEGPQLQREARIQRTLDLCLKSADLAHTAEAWDTHQMWVHLLEDELRQQASVEACLDMAPSTPAAASDGRVGWLLASQGAFMTSVVLPMFALLRELHPGTRGVHLAAAANAKTAVTLAASGT